jgi:hypothetical protein
VLSIIPIAATASRYESMLFGYPTSVAWDTYRIRLATDFVRDAGLQTGVIFLALAGLEAALPYALSLLRREGRARFGRSAAVAAVTALAIVVAVDMAMNWLDILIPSATSIDFNVPNEVARPLPALIEGGQALFAAVVFSAAVALFTSAARNRVAIVAMIAIFFASLDPGASGAQAGVMLVHAAATALLVWLIGRFVLGSNPLAWPLAALLGALLQGDRLDGNVSRPCGCLSRRTPGSCAGSSISSPRIAGRAGGSRTSPPISARSA